jgi:hypothetical protein
MTTFGAPSGSWMSNQRFMLPYTRMQKGSPAVIETMSMRSTPSVQTARHLRTQTTS